MLMNHCYKKGGHPAAVVAMRQYVHSIKIEILMLFVYYYSGMQQRPVKNRIRRRCVHLLCKRNYCTITTFGRLLTTVYKIPGNPIGMAGTCHGGLASMVWSSLFLLLLSVMLQLLMMIRYAHARTGQGQQPPAPSLYQLAIDYVYTNSIHPISDSIRFKGIVTRGQHSTASIGPTTGNCLLPIAYCLLHTYVRHPLL
jgi:hypothetical protein